MYVNLEPMDKGTLNQIFFRGQTAHRIPKLVTLGVTSCVFFAMISIDASASTSARSDTNAQFVRGAALESTVVPAVSAANTPTLGHSYRTHTTRTRSLMFGSREPKLRESALLSVKPKSKAKLVDPFSGPSGSQRKTTGTKTTTKTTTTPIFGFTPKAPTTTTTVKSARPPTTTSGSTTNNAPTDNPTTTTTGPAPTTTTTGAPTTTTTPPPTTSTTTGSSPSVAYPIGTADNSDQTGYAPPSATALAGYHQTYVTTFTGTSLPPDWQLYEGVPQGDSSGQFDRAHVTVSGGLLRINTYQDPNFNNEWVTGGTSLTGIAGQTYGAYFVRARLTGPGPTGVELLWPDAPVWPPEIDFNETYGSTTATSATVHYTSANSQIPKSLNIDMTQWHTFGVIWTASSITYTVDGNVWGTVTQQNAIPNIPMHISLQSQTWCSAGWACPTAPQSMLVDWVAEYTAN